MRPFAEDKGMPKILIGFLLAMASLARGEEGWRSIDDFENPGPRLHNWVSAGANVVKALDGAREGLFALRCDPVESGAWFGVCANIEGMAALRFWARVELEMGIEVEIRSRTAAARMWRKVDLSGPDWQEIVLPLWTFRTEGDPILSDCDLVAFRPRGTGSVWIDDLRRAQAVEAANPLIEPLDLISQRAFGKAAGGRAETRNFRVLTNSPIDAREVADGLEDFRDLFQERMRLRKWNIEVPVTVVIHETRDEYVDFVARTAREVYGGVIDPKGITAGGFTFERYSCTSYDPEQGAKRPVFYHEACHQLVTQCLGLRGPNGASWAEEGICYYLQNEYLPQANLAEEIGNFLENPKRPPLASLKDTTPTTGVVNMTGLLVMAFLAEGPHSDRLAAVLAELRDGHHDLGRAVERALEMKLDEFAAEWEAWVRETYR